MLGLDAYGADSSASDDDDADHTTHAAVTSMRVADAAPHVNSSALTLERTESGEFSIIPCASAREVVDPTSRVMTHNVRYDEMTAPIEGPKHEWREDRLTGRGARNHALGDVNAARVSGFHFEEQYNTYNARGYAEAPTGRGQIVGDAAKAAANRGETPFNMSAAKRRRVRAEVLASVASEDAGDGAPVDTTAWAPAREAKKVLVHDELNEKEKEYVKWHMDNREAKLRAKGKLDDDDVAGKPGENVGAEDDSKTSVFHGKSETNYAGLSWIAPPKDQKRDGSQCYAPKKCVHTFNGHTKGVSKIEFFPNTGHLLLSAGMDNVVKIWDVYNTRKCMRTYMGHDKAVKDVSFNSDGSRFVSTSWDKKVRLWDTETGKIIQTVTAGKIGYCCKIHPKQQNLVLVGQSDKKVIQWDMNNGDLVQEYDQHLGPVNSITWADGGERFMSSSDDKTLRVWEFGIPVTTKYIADPSMHSIPAVAISNSGKYIIGQSLDNNIVTFNVAERFRRNNKKRFGGHHNAGYACQPSFSNDDSTVVSGDGSGKLFFWDWKTTKIIKSIKAHDQVAIGVAWHPLKSSIVASCSWDKTIKLWE